MDNPSFRCNKIMLTAASKNSELYTESGLFNSQNPETYEKSAMNMKCFILLYNGD
jgi:hypothetical protein